MLWYLPIPTSRQRHASGNVSPMKYILNKTENPSKDALDKIENFAKFKLCKLWPDPPGWPDWSDKYSHRIEYERGGARTVKHVKLPVSMSQWVSYIRSSVQEMLAHLKMLITFERRVPHRSHASQNDHKSSGYLSKTSAKTWCILNLNTRDRNYVLNTWAAVGSRPLPLVAPLSRKVLKIKLFFVLFLTPVRTMSSWFAVQW